jgi:predicted Holliday junction resolvase-like endonuclease
MPRNKSVVMRISLISTMLLALPMVVRVQAEQLDNEGVVRQVTAQAYLQTYTSTGQKQLRRLGDETAVVLTKVIGGRVLDQHDVEPLLLMLELSFSDLRFVETTVDRQPRTTLVLLNYLELVTSDAELKKKIESTRAYVVEQYEKSQKQQDTTAVPQSR